MGLLLGGIIGSAVGGIGSAWAGNKAASSARDTNKEMMEYQKNRHQYNVKDLKKAGLNPALSVTSPSTVGSAPKLENPDGGAASQARIAAANSAADTALRAAQLKQVEAQTNLTNSQAEGVQIENDMQNPKKGISEKIWGVAEQGLDKVMDIGKDAANNAKTIWNAAKSDFSGQTKKPTTDKTSLTITGNKMTTAQAEKILRLYNSASGKSKSDMQALAVKAAKFLDKR